MVTSNRDTSARVEAMTVQGVEALVRRDPDEVYIQWHPRRPIYYGVRVGDRVKDADRDVDSPRIAAWQIESITDGAVVGTDVKTGESREWEREELELGLIVGTYATDLSDFALVTPHCVGSWEEYDPNAPRDASGTYRGRPYLTVVAYGNNGETYGLRYRFCDAYDDENVELWERDSSVEALSSQLQALIGTRVREVLEADGYAVHAD